MESSAGADVAEALAKEPRLLQTDPWQCPICMDLLFKPCVNPVRQLAGCA
jgi:hypothetical protein